MIVVLDGPEKAGKSTLAKKLVELSPWRARVRRWGPVEGKDRLYLYALQEDSTKVDELVVWDRSFASEAVYCNILPREGRLGEDPFAGEWDYGRLLQSMGARRMVLGPNVETLRRLRDGTDHKVCPATERRMFFRYSQTYRWKYVINAHTDAAVTKIAEEVLGEVRGVLGNVEKFGTYPPLYAGPQDPRVLVLGEPKLRRGSRRRDSWAPFGSRLTRQLGYELGVEALRYGWSNIGWCDPSFIRKVPIIVACGRNVEDWLLANVFNPSEYSKQVIPTYHPAWLFRYGEGLAKCEETISSLKKGIEDRWNKLRTT